VISGARVVSRAGGALVRLRADWQPRPTLTDVTPQEVLDGLYAELDPS